MAGNPSPEQTLYIGDNLIADIEGALGAGLTPIFVNPDNDLSPPGNVIKIQDLSQVLQLLSGEGINGK